MTQPSVIPISEVLNAPLSSRSGLRFLCRLGQGGMAEVHLAATSIVDGVHELVVVKRMHTQHLEDTATVRMFLDEARLALRLEHRHIVRTHRLGMFDGRHGIVMEFLEGQPLQHVLKRLPFEKLHHDAMAAIEHAESMRPHDVTVLQA